MDAGKSLWGPSIPLASRGRLENSHTALSGCSAPSIEVTRGSSFHTLHIYTHCALYPLLAPWDSEPTGFMLSSFGLLPLPRACPRHHVWRQG